MSAVPRGAPANELVERRRNDSTRGEGYLDMCAFGCVALGACSYGRMRDLTTRVPFADGTFDMSGRQRLAGGCLLDGGVGLHGSEALAPYGAESVVR